MEQLSRTRGRETPSWESSWAPGRLHVQPEGGWRAEIAVFPTHTSIGRRRHHSHSNTFSPPPHSVPLPLHPPPLQVPGASHWARVLSLRLGWGSLLDMRPLPRPHVVWIGSLRVGATEEAAGRGCAAARAGPPRRRFPTVRRWGAGSRSSSGCCGWDRAGSARPWSATAGPPPPRPRPPRRPRSRRPAAPKGGGGSRCSA